MKQLAFFVGLFVTVNLLGQQNEEDSTVSLNAPLFLSESKQTTTVPITMSYFANLGVHPGAKLSAEWWIFKLDKEKKKKKRIRKVSKAFILQPNLSFYSHKQSHSALQLNLDAVWRKYNRFFYAEIATGVGYQRRFNLGETFVTDESGEVSQVKSGTSRGYFTPSLSFGLGKDFTIKQTQSFSIFARFNSHLIVNYSAGSVVDMSGELGIRYNSFGLLRNSMLKVKKKSK